MRQIKQIYLTLFSSILLLTGCIVQSQSPASATQQHTSGPQLLNKTAASGETIAVLHSIIVNPDCTSREIATVRVTQPPAHGTTQVIQSEDYPTFAADNSRATCNKIKLPGMFVYYTPSPGFTGSDAMTVETITHSGVDVEYKVFITVK